MLTSKSRNNDFGMDFFSGGKVIKLNECLSDTSEDGAVSTVVVFSRDGTVALIRTTKQIVKLDLINESGEIMSDQSLLRMTRLEFEST